MVSLSSLPIGPLRSFLVSMICQECHSTELSENVTRGNITQDQNGTRARCGRAFTSLSLMLCIASEACRNGPLDSGFALPKYHIPPSRRIELQDFTSTTNTPREGIITKKSTSPAIWL